MKFAMLVRSGAIDVVVIDSVAALVLARKLRVRLVTEVGLQASSYEPGTSQLADHFPNQTQHVYSSISFERRLASCLVTLNYLRRAHLNFLFGSYGYSSH